MSASEGSIPELLQQAAERLRLAEVPTPLVDAELLLADVLGIGRGELHSWALMGRSITEEQAEQYQQWIARREAREPLQHITGSAAFRSLSLAVGPGVFVPRPETELLVEHALKLLREADVTTPPLVLDIGTGSGAIALSIATEFPQSRVFAVEKSAEAHRWASKNFAAIGTENARLLLGDIAHPEDSAELSELMQSITGTLTLLVSNPPYIPRQAIPRDAEVRLYDPELALYSGEDGLDLIRVLSRLGQQLLHPGGTMLLEHGEHQAADIAQILSADSWGNIFCEKDLTSRDRFTISTKLS